MGLVCLLAGVVLWSTAEVVTRTVAFSITPLQLGAARFVIGTAILLPFLPREMRRRGLRADRRILSHAAWIALVGVVGSNVAYQYGLQRAGASIVATVFGATPLMVMLLAAPLLRERITLPKVVGLTVGFLGIVVLAMSHRSAVFTVPGLLLAIVAAFCFAAFTVLVKKFAGSYAGLPITAYCAAFGAAFLLLLALFEGQSMRAIDLRAIGWPILYLGVGPTGLAFLLFFTGLDHVEATQATSIVLLKPPLAAVLAWAWLGEPLTWNLALAMVMIVGGLYLVIWLARYQRIRLERPPKFAQPLADSRSTNRT